MWLILVNPFDPTLDGFYSPNLLVQINTWGILKEIHLKKKDGNSHWQVCIVTNEKFIFGSVSSKIYDSGIIRELFGTTKGQKKNPKFFLKK